MLSCVLQPYINKIKMKKGKHLKALYHFTKQQKNKDSGSTNDVNDSLDYPDHLLKPRQGSITKQNHYRTQSCPAVEPGMIQSQIDIRIQGSQVSEKDATTRIHESKIKRGHRNCKSQAQIDSVYCPQMTASIDNLSSILYRKNSKECVLKKSRLGFGKVKAFGVEREHYNKVKLEQQMKKYQLNEELAELDKKSRGIAVKQQILYNLLGKFEGGGSSQELIMPD